MLPRANQCVRCPPASPLCSLPGQTLKDLEMETTEGKREMADCAAVGGRAEGDLSPTWPTWSQMGGVGLQNGSFLGDLWLYQPVLG